MAMEHIPSYITLTSTPFFTFSSNKSLMVFHISPSSMIKYSKKIYFSAFFISSSILLYLYSPSGKYSIFVFLYIGYLLTLSTYLAKLATCILLLYRVSITSAFCLTNILVSSSSNSNLLLIIFTPY